MNWTRPVAAATGTLSLFAILLLATGCHQEAKSSSAKVAAAETSSAKATAAAAKHNDKEAMIQAVRAKLSPEDRKLVDAQEWCVESEEPLGSMDEPIKLTIKGETVFICCKSCEKSALANPDKTLAKVKELKAKKLAGTGK